MMLLSSLSAILFLSTPSARRATRDAHRRAAAAVAISIHALRKEGDFFAHSRVPKLATFLSTPSARRATCSPCPRSDRLCYFYPRPPRGGRRRKSSSPEPVIYFYPRPPRGGRPAAVTAVGSMLVISIHALREEGDEPWQVTRERPLHFYLRPPRGGRRQKQRQNLYFLINYTTFCTNLEEL